MIYDHHHNNKISVGEIDSELLVQLLVDILSRLFTPQSIVFSETQSVPMGMPDAVDLEH